MKILVFIKHNYDGPRWPWCMIISVA